MANSCSGPSKHERISSEMMSSRSGRSWGWDLFGEGSSEDVESDDDKCTQCLAVMQTSVRFKCMVCENYVRCASCEALENQRIEQGGPAVHDKTHVFAKIRPGQVFISTTQ